MFVVLRLPGVILATIYADSVWVLFFSVAPFQGISLRPISESAASGGNVGLNTGSIIVPAHKNVNAIYRHSAKPPGKGAEIVRCTFFGFRRARALSGQMIPFNWIVL